MRHSPNSAAGRPARWCVALVLCGLTLALAACGGGDDDDGGFFGDTSSQEGGNAGSDSGNASGDDTGFTASSDEGSLQVGGGDRPDWTPAWLLIPEDLQITLAYDDASIGESAITGFIIDGDLELLYEQAKSMVQSGGYLIEDEYDDDDRGFGLVEPGASLTFYAEHTGDGGAVRFGVVRVDDQTLQWSIELVAAGGGTDGQNASGDSDTSNAAPDDSGTMTVSAGGETFTSTGICVIYNEGEIDNFASEVGTFAIINDDPPMANGYFQRPPGGSYEDWIIPNTAESTVAEGTADTLHYEGPGTVDGIEADFTVDVECP